MISLENVSKTYHTRTGEVPVLKNINMRLRDGERLGVLGKNGAGKSTLIRLISGVEQPTSGLIERDMSISWPLAFGGAFLGLLSGLDNFKFICRLYNVDPADKIDFVEDFCELGSYFREPMKTYSSGMRARLAFAVSMAIEFDCFLIDEIVAVGDSRFQGKCNYELFGRRGDRAFIIVSHSADFIRAHCNTAAVLIDGRLHHYDSIDEAYADYNDHMAGEATRRPTPMLTPGLTPLSQPEKDIQEAIMEHQITGLSNLLMHAIESKLDDVNIGNLLKAFNGNNLEPELVLGVANHMYKGGNLYAATRFIEIMINAQGDNSRYDLALGDFYYLSNQDKKAIDRLSKAIAADERSFWACRNLGMTYFKIGAYQECIPYFTTALQLTESPAHYRELIWLIFDSYLYLDQDVPTEIQQHAKVPASEIIELTPIYYSNFGLLRLRVQGFIKPGISRDEIECEVAIAGTRFPATDIMFGTNSIRRYADFAGAESFSANFYIALATLPEALELELIGADHSVGLMSRKEKALKLARSQTEIIIDARPSPDGWSPQDGYATFADHLFLTHDNEMACAYYCLANAVGEPLDSERYVEGLIALGRFNEAEWHLKGLFEGNNARTDLLDEKGGKLFDLYCAEIARSRLRGWDSKIDDLVAQRLRQSASEASGLTNLGHMHVHRGNIDEAVKNYALACQAAEGREMIHFSRGISSARYADMRLLSDFPSEGALPKHEQIVHFISCDAKYFKRYGQAVISSSARARGAENVFLHVHIVDPDLDALNLSRHLQTRYRFEVTSEFFPFSDASHDARIAYYTSARFINAPAIMQLYDRPVLITETDCQINWNWDDIREWTSGVDYGALLSSLWNLVPWTKIPAGIAYFDSGPKGMTVARFVRDFLMTVFSNPEASKVNLWTVDQVAQWLAWEKFHAHVKARHLPMTSILNLATGDKTNILITDE